MTENGKLEIRERLFKTRRLLMATSIVLLAHHALGVQVHSDAETLGLRFDFGDVAKIWWALWGVWLWALVTYLQHFREIRSGEFPRAEFNEGEIQVSKLLVRRDLKRIEREKGLGGREPKTLTRLDLAYRSTTTIGKNTPNLAYTAQAYWGKQDSMEFKHSRPKLNPFWWVVVNLGAWIRVIAVTRYGTDYYAPILLAFVALGFGIHGLFLPDARCGSRAGQGCVTQGPRIRPAPVTRGGQGPSTTGPTKSPVPAVPSKSVPSTNEVTLPPK